jgi:hypothetical protein
VKLVVSVQGDMRKIMSQKVDDAKLAVTAGVSRTGKGLKTEWRSAVAGALGRRLGNAIREKTYPEGRTSLRAASMVYAQPARNGRGAAAIVDAFNRGVTITSEKGFLTIPLPAAGKGARGARMTPALWEQKTGRRLEFVYIRGGTSLLVDKGRAAPGNVMVRKRSRGGVRLAAPTTYRNRFVPIFALVPRVKLPKKFDLAAATARAQATLAGNIIAAWPKETA